MHFTQLQHLFALNNKSITEEEFNALERYAQLLVEWNEKINLISRKDVESVWENHILHSLSIYFLHNLADVSAPKILDLGSGGGLPGIPLNIMLPVSSFTLVDSIQKKMNAVREMLAVLKLPHIIAITARVEELATQREHKHTYDYVVTRAVTTLPTLIQWSDGLLKKEGTLLALKGGNLDAELQSIPPTHTIDVHEINLKGMEYFMEGEKKLVVVKRK